MVYQLENPAQLTPPYKMARENVYFPFSCTMKRCKFIFFFSRIPLTFVSIFFCRRRARASKKRALISARDGSATCHRGYPDDDECLHLEYRFGFCSSVKSTGMEGSPRKIETRRRKRKLLAEKLSKGEDKK